MLYRCILTLRAGSHGIFSCILIEHPTVVSETFIMLENNLSSIPEKFKDHVKRFTLLSSNEELYVESKDII